MPDTTTTDPTTVDIPARLFANNSLVIITKSCWGGGSTVKEGDEEIFGANNFDSNFFKRGGVSLVAKEHLQPFHEVITRLTGYMGGMGRMFLTRGITLIKNDQWREIRARIEESQVEMEAHKVAFLANYDSIMEARVRAFNEAHPAFRGRLDRYFPPISELEKSFGITYVSFAITDPEGLAEAFSGERDRLRVVASQYVDSLAAEFRQTILESVTAFKTSIEKAGTSDSHTVNTRSLNAFRSFLNRIESNDFLGDREVMTLLNDLKFGIQNVEDWKVADGNLQIDQIKRSLDAIVTVASDEGAAASLARNFISAPVDEIENDVFDGPVVSVGRETPEEVVV